MIEDDPNDAELLIRKLRTGGFLLSTHRTDQLPEVKRALIEDTWDLVLSDHSMPGFRSSDVLELLTEHAVDTPLVIVSGAIGEQEVVEALHHGAAGYVDKASLSRLVPMIERVLEGAELRRRHARAVQDLELVRAAIDSANDLIAILEVREREAPAIVFVNGACERITGYSGDELIARGPDILRGPDTDRAAIGRVMRAMARGNAATTEWLLYCKNDTATWMETEVHPIEAGSNRFISVSRDITERKKSEAEFAFLATHDPLTSLANRKLLDERLHRDLARARRTGSHVAVMLVDLDGFKEVNDSFGHASGDELLRELGRRLTCCTRETDTVARLGGDEFVVVLADAAGLEPIARAAERILDCVSKPVVIGGNISKLSISIGIAVHPNDGETPAALIKSADQAMYHVKMNGKHGFHFAGIRSPF